MGLRVIVAHNFYRSALPSGENTVVGNEMRWLAAAGVTVVPYLRSSDDITFISPTRPIWSPQRELARLIRRHRPDVLHLHNPYPLISPAVIHTAHRHGVPVVQTVHNYRHVCVNGLFYREGRDCHDCVGKAFATPAIRHGCYRGSRAQSAVMATALAVHRPAWRSVDGFIAPSSVLRDHLTRYGIAPQRIIVKPNAAEDPGPLTPPGTGALFAGRLEEAKGIRQLLQAWDPALGTLTVAGGGPLEKLVQHHRHVSYVGNLDGDGVRAAIRAAAFVIVPSQAEDVHPTIVIESLANGRAVLGTHKGGIPEMIGPAGWVADDLARALPGAFAQAPALSAVARQRYLDIFSPEACARQLINIYTHIKQVL